MRKLIFYSIVVLIISGLLALTHGFEHASVIDFLVHIIAATFLVCLETIVENWKHFWLFVVTNTWYSNTTIRLSISYLFKIKVNDRYLLVKGNRVPNQYQPVGGVYKRLRESYYQLKDLKVVDDDNVPIDDVSINDLRIKMPAPSVPTFIKWFNSQRGREVSVAREFHEELIATGILSNANFPYPNYIYIGRHQTDIHFSRHFNCHEILIADLFELQPDHEQLAELVKKMNEPNPKYVWVNEARIKNKGAIPNGTSEFTISETAGWLI